MTTPKILFAGIVVEADDSWVTVHFDDDNLPDEENQEVNQRIPVDLVGSHSSSEVDCELEAWEQPTTVEGLGVRTESPGCKYSLKLTPS